MLNALQDPSEALSGCTEIDLVNHTIHSRITKIHTQTLDRATCTLWNIVEQEQINPHAKCVNINLGNPFLFLFDGRWIRATAMLISYLAVQRFIEKCTASVLGKLFLLVFMLAKQFPSCAMSGEGMQMFTLAETSYTPKFPSYPKICLKAPLGIGPWKDTCCQKPCFQLSSLVSGWKYSNDDSHTVQVWFWWRSLESGRWLEIFQGCWSYEYFQHQCELNCDCCSLLGQYFHRI